MLHYLLSLQCSTVHFVSSISALLFTRSFQLLLYCSLYLFYQCCIVQCFFIHCSTVHFLLLLPLLQTLLCSSFIATPFYLSAPLCVLFLQSVLHCSVSSVLHHLLINQCSTMCFVSSINAPLFANFFISALHSFLSVISAPVFLCFIILCSTLSQFLQSALHC